MQKVTAPDPPGGEVGPAHQTMVRKTLANGDVHAALAHAVTGYDRQQQARASAKGGYYNPNALGIYLRAVEGAASDIKGGMTHANAINNHFNGGLARSLHKTFKTGSTDIDTMRKPTFK